ncbi:MAG: RNA polymerase sigma factor [Myxococcota bacterium]
MTAHQATLERATAGDEAALELLVRTYHARVYRFGLRVCRDGFDAEDAVQEAFQKLARRPELQSEPLSWLYRVVKNACLRLLRPFQRERRTLGERVEMPDTVRAEDESPEDALLRFERVRRVHEAIAALPKDMRAVVILRDLEGLSGEEAAARLGLQLSAMKSRLLRARQLLRERLVAEAGRDLETSKDTTRPG